MPAKRLPSLLLITFVFLFVACDSTNPAPPTGGQPTMIVRDDLALLRTRINLPTTVTGAKWTALPLGIANSQVPGPTDTVLYAYLTAKDAQPLSYGAQPRQGSPQQIITISTDVAQAILPPGELASVVKKPGSYQMQGIAYDSSYFDGGSYRGTYAILVGDGMLVALQTQ